MNEIITNSPARLLINGETITADNIDSEIDNVIAELQKTNDPTIMDNAITTMIGLSKVSLFSLAHLLYGYNLWWLDTNQDDVRGDTFEDYIQSVHGLNPTVMGRYVSIWHHRMAGEFPDEIKALPLTFQSDIATKLLDEGYNPTEEEWEDLADAPNTSHLNRVIREIKGKPPTKASYVGYLERNGDIVFWHQDQRFNCGYIKLPEMADDDLERRVLEKVKARAIKGLGLKEK